MSTSSTVRGSASTDPYEVMSYYYDIFAVAAGGDQTSPRGDVFAALAAPGDTVLDLGSGTGAIALRLAENGCTVHCFEPSRPMRAIHLAKLAARPSASARTTVLDWDVTAFPSEVDYVVSAGVLQYLDAAGREELFAQAREALREGGILAVDMVVDEIRLDWPRRLVSETVVGGCRYRLRSASEALTATSALRRAEYTVSLGERVIQRDVVERVVHAAPRTAVLAELRDAGFDVERPPGDFPDDLVVARKPVEGDDAEGADRAR